MVEKTFELRKIRDFGENLGDTFLFIRKQSKPLLGSFFVICGAFILLNSVMTGFFQSSMFQGILDAGTTNRSFNRRFATVFSLNYFMTLLSTVMAYTAMQVALFSYIKVYAAKGGASPMVDEVWQVFTRNFFKILLFNIPIFFMTIAGMLMCLAPGIYLGVVFAPFSMIVIFEEISFGEAFSRCFEIIKDSFWTAFVTYLVAGIIYYVCGFIVGGAVSAVATLITYLTTKDLSSSVGVLTSFLNVFSLAFYIIPLISIALHYFTMVEKRDGTGILNRINSIGEKKINPDSGEEDF